MTDLTISTESDCNLDGSCKTNKLYLYGFIIVCLALLVLVIIILVVLNVRKGVMDDSTQRDAANKQKSTTFDVNIIKDVVGGSSDGNVKLTYNGVNINGNCYGDKITCSNNSRCFWDINSKETIKSTCIAPFFWSDCSRESYNITNYTAIGRNNNNINIIPLIDSNNIPIVYKTERISFPSSLALQGTEKICTKKCDDDPTCNGVYITPITNTIDKEDCVNNSCFNCNLIKDIIVTNPDYLNIYEPLNDSNIFMKNGNNPLIKNRVYLYAKDTTPLRYWLNSNQFDEQNRMGSFEVGKRYQIDGFKPTRIINDTGGGIYGNEWYGILYNDINSLDISSTESITSIIIAGSNTFKKIYIVHHSHDFIPDGTFDGWSHLYVYFTNIIPT